MLCVKQPRAFSIFELEASGELHKKLRLRKLRNAEPVSMNVRFVEHLSRAGKLGRLY